ncbi:MAG: glucosaminidase domain-containing protein, partial [Bacilli bacterium]|nr:glucosaminidase domain-containing protein [Bacilli bacterium]
DKSSSQVVSENIVTNSIIFADNITYNRYEPEIVYKGLTLDEVGAKIDKYMKSTLRGYGKYLASISLENDVDPIVAASIILVETGCQRNCSALVKKSNNVGGMRGSKGYLKYESLEAGLNAFVKNLSRNYYAKGLTTPKLMNKKYAENPNWHKDVNYYVNLIKAS